MERLKKYQVDLEKKERYTVTIEVLASSTLEAREAAIDAAIGKEFGVKNWLYDGVEYKHTHVAELKREDEKRGFIGIL